MRGIEVIPYELIDINRKRKKRERFEIRKREPRGERERRRRKRKEKKEQKKIIRNKLLMQGLCFNMYKGCY
jgi:hypothetical protein